VPALRSPQGEAGTTSRTGQKKKAARVFGPERPYVLWLLSAVALAEADRAGDQPPRRASWLSDAIVLRRLASPKDYCPPQAVFRRAVSRYGKNLLWACR
jgi:hypothetical protein